MKILIAENNINLCRLYKEEFQEEGYDVLIASTGKEALELFSAETPDIVAMEVLMPDIDGLTLVNDMKKHNPYSCHYVYIIRFYRYIYRIAVRCICG